LKAPQNLKAAVSAISNLAELHHGLPQQKYPSVIEIKKSTMK